MAVTTIAALSKTNYVRSFAMGTVELQLPVAPAGVEIVSKASRVSVPDRILLDCGMSLLGRRAVSAGHERTLPRGLARLFASDYPWGQKR